MSAAIYAGTFDPITNGHVSIIQSGLVAFDRIIVAVLSNSKKQPLFSVDERIEMIADAIKGDPRVEVDRFEDGLLVDYARAQAACASCCAACARSATSSTSCRWPT